MGIVKILEIMEAVQTAETVVIVDLWDGMVSTVGTAPPETRTASVNAHAGIVDAGADSDRSGFLLDMLGNML